MVRSFRGASRGKAEIFILTDKAKMMCDRMHKMLIGDEDIPTNARYNKLAESGGKRINNYYMDIIKKMNKENKGRGEE